MMEEYNAEISSVRVSVEWLFGNIINDFKFLDFKKNLKIGMSSVGKMYLVCALLHNAIIKPAYMETAPLSFLGLTLLPYRTTSNKSNELNDFMSVKVNIHI